MTSDEKMLFSNGFGSVTDKRVILNYKDGSEDIPISQVSSVSYKHERSYFFSIGGFVAAAAVLFFMLSMMYVFKPIWTFHVKKLKTFSILKLVNFFDFRMQS